MPHSKKSIASEIAEAMKKKKKRIIETDPETLSWKALESGGLDPVEINEEFADEFESELEPRAEKLPPRWMRKDQGDIRKELKGMGPEGKRFLKDKLSDKKYEGKLKPKYKKDLLKELHGMSRKGRGYVKKELGYPMPFSKQMAAQALSGRPGEKTSEEDQRNRFKKLELDKAKSILGKLKGAESLEEKATRLSYGDIETRKRAEKLAHLQAEGEKEDRFSTKAKLEMKKEKEKPKAADKSGMEFKGPEFLKPKDWDDWSEKRKETGAKIITGAMSDIGKSIGQGFSDVKSKQAVRRERGDSLAEKSKFELAKELHSMGPEGKRFLKDKLDSKEYKGKLKPEYKKDLLKELYGMSRKGKQFVKKEVGDVQKGYGAYKPEAGDVKKDSRKKEFGPRPFEDMPKDFNFPTHIRKKLEWRGGKWKRKDQRDIDKKSYTRTPAETREYIMSERFQPRGFGGKLIDKKKVFSKYYKNKEGGDVLSYGERQRMPKGDFALPGKGGGPKGKQGGSYPIPDISHARNALARISQFGNPAQKRKVRAAVAKKFPSIKMSR